MTGTACGPTSAPPLGNSPRLKTMMRALPPEAWTSTKRREISSASVVLSRSINGGTCREANGWGSGFTGAAGGTRAAIRP
jgi:hypothetical protein